MKRQLNQQKIYVAMSGGVDSSVAPAPDPSSTERCGTALNFYFNYGQK